MYGDCSSSQALMVHGITFALLDSKGEFVVKLPKASVDALVAEGQGQRFAPGMGWLIREWLVVTPVSEQPWLSLAREALSYVRSTWENFVAADTTVTGGQGEAMNGNSLIGAWKLVSFDFRSEDG